MLIKPLQGKTEKLKNDFHQLESEARSSKNKLAGLKNVVGQQQQLLQFLEQTPSLMFDSSSFDKIVGEMVQMAEINGLQINEIVPGEPMVEQYFDKNELNIKLGGTFPQVRTYLDQLRNKLPLARCSKLSMRVIEQSGNGLCRIQLQFIIFYTK